MEKRSARKSRTRPTGGRASSEARKEALFFTKRRVNAP